MGLRERFDEKWTAEPNTGCWLWLGHITPTGYSQFAKSPRETKAGHRVSWELAGRTIPPGMQLDHVCQVRSCVNPAHLRAVTPRQNRSHLVGKKTGRYSSQYTGVCFNKVLQKWGASVMFDGKKTHLGVFADERDAAMAYQMAIRERTDG